MYRGAEDHGSDPGLKVRSHYDGHRHNPGDCRLDLDRHSDEGHGDHVLDPFHHHSDDPVHDNLSKNVHLHRHPGSDCDLHGRSHHDLKTQHSRWYYITTVKRRLHNNRLTSITFHTRTSVVRFYFAIAIPFTGNAII